MVWNYSVREEFSKVELLRFLDRGKQCGATWKLHHLFEEEGGKLEEVDVMLQDDWMDDEIER